MRPSPPTHPSSQPSPHPQPPTSHGQMMSGQVSRIDKHQQTVIYRDTYNIPDFGGRITWLYRQICLRNILQEFSLHRLLQNLCFHMNGSLIFIFTGHHISTPFSIIFYQHYLCLVIFHSHLFNIIPLIIIGYICFLIMFISSPIVLHNIICFIVLPWDVNHYDKCYYNC